MNGKPVLSTAIKSGWASPLLQQTIAFGVPIAEALPEAARRLSARRLAVISTNSLSAPGGLAESVCRILGDRFHTLVTGIHAHTPRADVIRVVKALEGADGVVTIGGGSVCDSAKAARLCLANSIFTSPDIDRLRPYHKAQEAEPDPTLSPSLPFIAIPTTLSAAEYTSGGGVTDERGPVKQVFMYPGMAPDIVLLDPEMTKATPSRLFFASGMRAVDHAVEAWCSIAPTPVSDAFALHAFSLLVNGMRKVFDAPEDLQARLDCMQGSWLSIVAPAAGGVKAGASHGMGHALGGTTGMLHGETSCVMLPQVLRYNAAVNADRQAELAAAIGAPQTPLADIIAGLVAHLNLPGRLSSVGVKESQIDMIADAALHDPLLRSNPIPITTIAEVHKLLKAAW
jgi:maleylacetate reductase